MFDRIKFQWDISKKSVLGEKNEGHDRGGSSRKNKNILIAK